MTQQSTIGTPEPAAQALTRRRFIIAAAAAAGGLAIGFRIPGASALPGIAAQPWTMTPDAAAKEVNAWIVIAADDSVTSASPSPKWARAASRPWR